MRWLSIKLTDCSIRISYIAANRSIFKNGLGLSLSWVVIWIENQCLQRRMAPLSLCGAKQTKFNLINSRGFCSLLFAFFLEAVLSSVVSGRTYSTYCASDKRLTGRAISSQLITTLFWWFGKSCEFMAVTSSYIEQASVHATKYAPNIFFDSI